MTDGEAGERRSHFGLLVRSDNTSKSTFMRLQKHTS